MKSIKSLFKILGKSNNSENEDKLPDLSLLPPPPIWSRILIWTLGAGTIFLVTWSFVVKVEETVSFSGEITTSSSAVQISIPDAGVILSIPVKPNQAVKKGEILMVCENKEISIRILSINKRLELLGLQQQSDKRINDLRRSQLQEQIDLNYDLLNRQEFLLKAGAVQETQVLSLRSRLKELQFQLSGIEEQEQRGLNQTNQSIEELTNSKLELQAKSERFTVRSPVTGFIHQMKYQTIGERVKAGEQIFSIIPKLDLIAQVNIPSELRAPVEINSDASISVDAFPVNEFGTITAKVNSLSPMTQQSSSTQRKLYKADLILMNPSSSDKFDLNDLRPGMSVTAQMVLRKKPVITTVFNMLDKLFEPVTKQE